MKKSNRKVTIVKKEVVTLEELAKRGAQEMLRRALGEEVDGYLEREKHKRSCQHRGYRNGYGKERHLSFCGAPVATQIPPSMATSNSPI